MHFGKPAIGPGRVRQFYRSSSLLLMLLYFFTFARLGTFFFLFFFFKQCQTSHLDVPTRMSSNTTVMESYWKLISQQGPPEYE